MGLTLQIELTDGQLAEIEDRLFKRLLKSAPNYGKRTKPYTVKKFMEATGMKKTAVYDAIAAKEIETVKDAKPYLIKASELERFMG